MDPILQFLLILIIILFSAKLGAAFSYKISQPSVFGKLLIGLILGPTFLHLLGYFPDKNLGHTLSYFAQIGVILLMFIAGLETDLEEMKKVGKAAFLSASGGVILPMLGGISLSLLFNYNLKEAIFIGVILTATSVSISAQTLMELGKLQSKEGTTIIGAAVIDDVIGIIILSFVIGFERGTGVSFLSISILSLKIFLFFILSIYIGFKFLPKLTNYVSSIPASEIIVAFTLIICFLYAWAAEYLGSIAAITGSYVAGIIFAKTNFKEEIEHRFKILGYSFFIPIFFINIGLEANARTIVGKASFAILIILFAIIGKILGCYLGAIICKFSNLESIRVGVGMVSRGEIALIVATIGLKEKIIGMNIFSSMIMMTLITTLITPILLRMLFPKEKIVSEELIEE